MPELMHRDMIGGFLRRRGKKAVYEATQDDGLGPGISFVTIVKSQRNTRSQCGHGILWIIAEEMKTVGSVFDAHQEEILRRQTDLEAQFPAVA